MARNHCGIGRNRSTDRNGSVEAGPRPSLAYGTGPRLRNDVDVGYSDVAANRERKWRPIPVHKLVCDVYWTHRLARSTTNEDVHTGSTV